MIEVREGTFNLCREALEKERRRKQSKQIAELVVEEQLTTLVSGIEI